MNRSAVFATEAELGWLLLTSCLLIQYKSILFYRELKHSSRQQSHPQMQLGRSLVSSQNLQAVRDIYLITHIRLLESLWQNRENMKRCSIFIRPQPSPPPLPPENRRRKRVQKIIGLFSCFRSVAEQKIWLSRERIGAIKDRNGFRRSFGRIRVILSKYLAFLRPKGCPICFEDCFATIPLALSNSLSEAAEIHGL